MAKFTLDSKQQTIANEISKHIQVQSNCVHAVSKDLQRGNRWFKQWFGLCILASDSRVAEQVDQTFVTGDDKHRFFTHVACRHSPASLVTNRSNVYNNQ